MQSIVPCCCAASCLIDFAIRICSGLGIAGVIVDTYQGGISLDSGTTDPSGAVTLTGSSSAFSVDLTSPTPRVASRTIASVHPACGSALVLSMFPAAGYTCTPPISYSCALPVATTLYLTSILFGSATLTLSGGAYTGTTTYFFPGCAGCPAKTVTIHWTLSAGTLTATWDTIGAFVPECPWTAGSGSTASWTYGLTSASCPPSFSLVFDTGAPVTSAQLTLGCGATDTVTVTE